MYFAALFNYHLPCDFASFKDVFFFFYENCMKCFFAFYLCGLMVTWVASVHPSTLCHKSVNVKAPEDMLSGLFPVVNTIRWNCFFSLG